MSIESALFKEQDISSQLNPTFNSLHVKNDIYTKNLNVSESLNVDTLNTSNVNATENYKLNGNIIINSMSNANFNSLTVKGVSPFNYYLSASNLIVPANPTYDNPILSFYYGGSNNTMLLTRAIVALNMYGNTSCSFRLFDISGYAFPYTTAPTPIGSVGVSTENNKFVTSTIMNITACPTGPSIIGLYGDSVGSQQAKCFGITLFFDQL